jgi:simple sugar transport system ATP-binding protein
MFGRVLVEPEPGEQTLGEPVLELEGATLRGPTVTTPDLTLSVREGEVVGLAGLEGSGQGTLLRACAGLLEPDAGAVRIAGRDLTGGDYREFVAAGMHYLPAGRLEEGLVPGLSIAEHFVLADGERPFFVDWNDARRSTQERIEDNHIVGGPDSTADGLSGGNQQRLLLAMMPPDVRLMLMEHPTRGLDIESAAWVWSRLLDRRAAGCAIVFASADLDELLRYSDRILVFFAGEVLKVLDARATSGEELGYLIGGKERV